MQAAGRGAHICITRVGLVVLDLYLIDFDYTNVHNVKLEWLGVETMSRDQNFTGRDPILVVSLLARVKPGFDDALLSEPAGAIALLFLLRDPVKAAFRA